jgi:hypothetical protein
MILWIDDIRNPSLTFFDERVNSLPIVVCRTVDAAKSAILTFGGLGAFDYIFLDHDLGIDMKTGNAMNVMDVLYFAQQNTPHSPPKEGSVYFTSANLVGINNMKSFIESWQKTHMERFDDVISVCNSGNSSE